MKKVFIILSLLILIACSKDPYGEYDIANKEYANAIFEPYFDEFKKEAAERDYNFDDYEIQFYLADISGDGEYTTGGLGNYSTNEIIVDRDHWYQIDSNQKAFLIFHELGHAVLNRKHTNVQTENQECLSFMRIRTSSDKCQLNYYSDLWREFYFNELFEENTSLPDWYKNNQTYIFNYENKALLIEELANENRTYQMDIDTISNFVLEVIFKNWESTSENAPFRNTKINLNGINFETNPNDNAVHISNYDYSEKYFSKWDYKYEEDIKLTIRRNDEVYSFFIDENLVHITDIDFLKNESINVEFSSGIKKDIVLFRFE